MRATAESTTEMAFDVAIRHHHLTIDAKSEHGGGDGGPTPKELLLASLAGCTAMDVISILRKMRQRVTAFRVHAEGTQTEGPHPHTVVGMVLTYECEGEVQPAKLWRAVHLSHGTYCGVSAMLGAHDPISVRVVLNGEELADPG